MTCPDCGERMDHCHGTLVLHVELVECTDPACARPHLARHPLVLSCGELDCSACAGARTWVA